MAKKRPQNQQPKGPLTVSEAEARVKPAVDQLEEAINKVDGTPGKKSKKRREALESTMMGLLAGKYGIVPDKPLEDSD